MLLQAFSIIVNVGLLIALGLWISIAYRWKRAFFEERRQKEELWAMCLNNLSSVNGINFRDWIAKVLENNEMMEDQNGKQTDSINE